MAGELGFGATLAYSDTLGGTYTAVANVLDVMAPPITATRVDKSYHGMSNPYREFAAGLGAPGEIDVVVFFAKAHMTTLYGLHRTDKFWRVQAALISGETTPSMFRSAGFLADIQLMLPIDDKMVANLKIVLSGKPTFTEGS